MEEEEVGMLGITPELEAKGRGADTEVGYIEVGSIVIPEPIATDPDLAEMFDSLKRAIEMQGQNPEQFTVTPENTLYAYNQDNAIPAHLTNGEFVVPVQVLNVVPDLQAQLAELFSAGNVDINEYTVGNEANSINPTTGYPEFLFKKIWNKAKKLVKSTGKAIKRGVDGVVDFTENFVKSLGQGVEDLFKGDIDAVLKNPAVVATASFFAPQYAAYINLGSKAATGQKITATDLVSAGFSATTDFTKVKIDPNAVKAVKTAALIEDGADPAKTLALTYGADFAKDLGLDKKVSSSLDQTFGEGTGQYVTNRLDVNKAAADLVAGKDITRAVTEQFNEDIVAALGADSPSQRAAGLAGIETMLQKYEGATDKDALLAGAQTYYDRGGELPKLNDIGNIAGLDTSKFNFETPKFFKDFSTKLNIDAPDIDFAYDFATANIGNVGDWFKGNLPNINLPDNVDWGQVSRFKVNAPELADVDFDFGKVDFSGYRPKDLGYDFDRFSFEGFEGMKDLGININQLDLDEFNIPQIGLALAAVDEKIPGELVSGDDEIESLENDLIKPMDGKPFSRKVLESTFA